MQTVDVLIIGAGPTGLGAARRVQLASQDTGCSDPVSWLAVEGSNTVGGLAKSYMLPEGYVVDHGIHATFSRIPEYHEFLRTIGNVEGELSSGSTADVMPGHALHEAHHSSSQDSHCETRVKQGFSVDFSSMIKGCSNVPVYVPSESCGAARDPVNESEFGCPSQNGSGYSVTPFWRSIVRNAVVFMKPDLAVPYPIQAYQDLIPDEILDDYERKTEVLMKTVESESTCSLDPAGISSDNTASFTVGSFQEHCLAKFGQKLYTAFFLPYNLKVWGTHPRDMGVSWLADRVAPKEQTTKSWGPNNVFLYPVSGGNGAVWNGCYGQLDRENFRFNERVVSVRVTDKTVATVDAEGRRQMYRYKKLISTMPADSLEALCEDEASSSTLNGSMQDGTSVDSEARLRYSSVVVICLGVKGVAPAGLTEYTWCYYPDPACAFHRVTLLSTYSKNNAREGTYSILLECPGNEFAKLVNSKRHDNAGSQNTSNYELSTSYLRKVVQSVIDYKILDPAVHYIETVFFHLAEKAYPVPTIARDSALERISARVGPDVLSVGRFGLWKYELSNQDDSFMQGDKAAMKAVTELRELNKANKAIKDPESECASALSPQVSAS